MKNIERDKEQNKKSKRTMTSKFDVNGAYTGTPSFDKDETPTQDADDL